MMDSFRPVGGREGEGGEMSQSLPAKSFDELLTQRGRRRWQRQEFFVFVLGADPALFVVPARLRMGFASSRTSLPDAVAHRVTQS